MNAWLYASPKCFREAVEDGVRQGAASALAVVYFQFPSAVNVHEVVGSFLRGVDPVDLAFLMPLLEDAADAILAIAPLDDILCGPSLDR